MQTDIERINAVIAKSRTGQRANNLLDTILAEFGIENDAALRHELGVNPMLISTYRRGLTPLGPMLILAIHENLGVSVDRIRALASS
jgi:hypothetical protein